MRKLTDKDVELLRVAVKRFDEAVDHDRDNRQQAEDDLRFLTVTGDGHWPREVRQQRERDLKPCLTINRLPQYLRQVTGDIRRVNPAIKIVPGDSEASEEMADLKNGLIRQIEAACGATSIYEAAAESAAACGMGAWRVLTKYADDDTFDQEIYLESIPNPFSVHWDPLAKDPTRKDARYCFVVQVMDKEDFEAEYPGATAEDWETTEIDNISWMTGERVTVAEYWWKQPITRKLAMIGGKVIDVTDETIPPLTRAAIKRGEIETRTVETHKVMWAKMTANTVLEGPEEWMGKHIPVVAVMGEELHVGEEVVRTSVIRYAKEPQQLYNYWRSAQAEVIALQPRAPYIITAKQIEGWQDMWQKANQSNQPVLVYNPDDKAPPPQRQSPPVASPAMMQEIMAAVDDLKATTGIFDASMGNAGNETSGRAIQARQVQGDTANSIYIDNLAKAIEQTGRIILDLMPKVYDTERVIRVLGENGQEATQTVNKTIVLNGQTIEVNSMLAGKYDVRVSTGPAYATLRQEAAEGMLSFVQAFPAAAPVVGDLIAKSMDWPNAEEFAERLKALVPPEANVKKPEDMSSEEQQAAQQAQAMQQQMKDMQDLMMQLQARLTAAEIAVKEADAAKKQAEAEQTRVETQTGAYTAQLDSALRVQEAGMRRETTAADLDQKRAQTWRTQNEPFKAPPEAAERRP